MPEEESVQSMPVRTNGGKILTLTVAIARTLQQIQKSMLGVSLRDHIRIEDLHRRTGVTNVVSQITRLKWNLVG